MCLHKEVTIFPASSAGSARAYPQVSVANAFNSSRFDCSPAELRLLTSKIATYEPWVFLIMKDPGTHIDR